MKSNGFELSTYSKAIQAEALRLDTLEKQKNSLRKQLISEPSEELEEQLVEIEGSIESQDNDLIAKINKYDKNRETYAMLGDKLKASREAKKQAKLNPIVEPIEPIVEPIVEPIEPIVDPIVEPIEEPKKKGGGGILVVGALLVIGSIIGVNLLKKK